MSNLISFEDEKAEERNSLGIVLTIKNVHEFTHTYRDIYVNYSKSLES